MSETAHLTVIVGCDQIHKSPSPLVAVDHVTPVSVLLHPIEHSMAELLVGVGLHDLGHEVVRLQALEVQVLLGVDLLGLLADGELLADPQKGHLHNAQSLASASLSLPGKPVCLMTNLHPGKAHRSGNSLDNFHKPVSMSDSIRVTA